MLFNADGLISTDQIFSFYVIIKVKLHFDFRFWWVYFYAVVPAFPNWFVVHLINYRIEVVEDDRFGGVEEEFVFYFIGRLFGDEMLEKLGVHEDGRGKGLLIFYVGVDFEKFIFNIGFAMGNSSPHLFILL